MSEDLAFHQLFRDSAAVDRHERIVATGALPVDRLRADFLAGARFAGDEHGGAAGRGAFDDPVDALHGERAADEAVEAASRQFPGIGIDDLDKAQPLDRVAHRHYQPVGGEGFDDEIIGAVAHRLYRHIDGGMGRDDDYGGRYLLAGYIFQDVHAVHIRQLEIQ